MARGTREGAVREEIRDVATLSLLSWGGSKPQAETTRRAGRKGVSRN